MARQISTGKRPAPFSNANRAGRNCRPKTQKYLDEAKRLRGQSGPARKGGPDGPAKTGTPLPNASTESRPTHRTDRQVSGPGRRTLRRRQERSLPGINRSCARQAIRAKYIRSMLTGQPAADGKIVLVSLGMSNTTMEFSTFKRLADNDAQKAGDLVIVDCAQGGKTAALWAGNDQPWDVAMTRLQAASVSPAQVQVMWPGSRRTPDRAHRLANGGHSINCATIFAPTSSAPAKNIRTCALSFSPAASTPGMRRLSSTPNPTPTKAPSPSAPSSANNRPTGQCCSGGRTSGPMARKAASSTASSGCGTIAAPMAHIPRPAARRRSRISCWISSPGIPQRRAVVREALLTLANCGLFV